MHSVTIKLGVFLTITGPENKVERSITGGKEGIISPSPGSSKNGIKINVFRTS
jgi:hypothetical protein